MIFQLIIYDFNILHQAFPCYYCNMQNQLRQIKVKVYKFNYLFTFFVGTIIQEQIDIKMLLKYSTKLHIYTTVYTYKRFVKKFNKDTLSILINLYIYLLAS